MTPRPMLRPNGGLMQTQKYIEKTFKTPLLKNCDASIVNIYDNLDCDPGNTGAQESFKY